MKYTPKVFASVWQPSFVILDYVYGDLSSPKLKLFKSYTYTYTCDQNKRSRLYLHLMTSKCTSNRAYSVFIDKTE